jgi:hypothetical protein
MNLNCGDRGWQARKEDIAKPWILRDTLFVASCAGAWVETVYI